LVVPKWVAQVCSERVTGALTVDVLTAGIFIMQPAFAKLAQFDGVPAGFQNEISSD
jgi:hypothetical protein